MQRTSQEGTDIIMMMIQYPGNLNVRINESATKLELEAS